MSVFKHLADISKALWRVGLLKVSLRELWQVIGAWRLTKGSFATLASIAKIRAPHHVALVDEQGSLTFGELYDRSIMLSHHLKERYQLHDQQRAAILCRNQRSFVLSMIALTHLGVDTLPLNTDLPASKLSATLKAQGVDLLLYDAELAQLIEEGVAIQRCCLDQIEPTLSARLNQRALRPPRARRTPALIVLTSGTTSSAKGVTRQTTLTQVLAPISSLVSALPIAMHRPILLPLPLYHGSGLCGLAMSLALCSPLHIRRPFGIGALTAQLAEGDEALIITVPTLIHRWLSQEEPALPDRALKALITGSAPLSAELSQEVERRLGRVLYNLYGSTEAGLMSLATPDELSEAPGTVGRPLSGVQLRLLGDDQREVARGERGEVWVSSSLVTQPTEGGWYRTGDLGRQDERGRLFVLGRSDQMIVTGGQNVYPQEVQSAICAHPAVAEARVKGASDVDLGQVVEAYVVLKSGERLDATLLKQWLTEDLDRYKLPRHIHFVERLPFSKSG